MALRAAAPHPATIAIGVARPSDHQNADRRMEPARGIPRPQPPPEEGARRDREHDRDEDRGDAIDKALDRRLRGLRALHQSDNPRERRAGAHGLCLDPQETVAIDRAADDEVTRRLVDRPALAGEKRFVGLAGSAANDTVDRKPCAWTDDHHVAYRDIGGRDLDLLPIRTQHPRRIRDQADERAYGMRGTAPRTRLQRPAEKHQRDHDRGGLQVMHRVAEGIAKDRRRAGQIGGAGPDRDQQVHIAGAHTQGRPCRAVEPEPETGGELHDRREGQGQQGGQVNRGQAEMAGHFRNKRRRKRQRDADTQRLAPRRVHLARWRTIKVQRRGAVPGSFDCRSRRGLRPRVGARENHPRRLGRQTHLGRGDTGDAEQRLLNPRDTGRTGHALDTKDHRPVHRGYLCASPAPAERVAKHRQSAENSHRSRSAWSFAAA
jgi:hypothetical protein